MLFRSGPRQCGKTTLAKRVGKRLGFEYVNLDDDAARRAAQDDPAGFVARLPERTIIDEVQRAPELFLPLKVEVDRRRVPGRFLLTGSANVLLLPRVADSLAGRMGSIRLHPMAQCEIDRREPKFLRALLQGDFKIRSSPRLGEELASRIASGGFPAALARSTQARRRQWYADYIDAMVQRDLRDISRIASLRTIPKLLKLAASQTARLINVSDLAAPFQVSRPTIRDYVTLLERIFVVDELQPWHSNRLKRLVKTPKLHLTDSGLACALLGITAADLWQDRTMLGQMLETFVYGELRRQASGVSEPVDFPSWNRSWPVRIVRRVSLATWILPLGRIFAWVRVDGLEHLDHLNGPVVFASNHQSHFDVPVILMALPGRWRKQIAPAMAKASSGVRVDEVIATSAVAPVSVIHRPWIVHALKKRNVSGLISSKRSSLPALWMRLKRNDPSRTAQTMTSAPSSMERR